MANPKKRKWRSTIIIGGVLAILSSILAASATVMLFWFASGFAVAATVFEAYEFGFLVGFALFSIGFILTGPILEAVLVSLLTLLPVMALGLVVGAVMAASIWGIYKLYSGDIVIKVELSTETMRSKSVAIIVAIAAVSALGASLTTALLVVLAPGVLLAAASLPAALAGLVVFTAFCAEIFILETMTAVSIAAVAGLIATAFIPAVAVGALIVLAYVGALDPVFDFIKTILGFGESKHQNKSATESARVVFSREEMTPVPPSPGAKLFQPAEDDSATPASSLGLSASQSDE